MAENPPLYDKPPPYYSEPPSSESKEGYPQPSFPQPNYIPGPQGGLPPGAQPSHWVPHGYSEGPPIYQQADYPNYGSTVYVHQQQPQIIVVGGCPACRVGVLEDDFTCLGICLAICFFPLGILCCLAMRQRRCPNCGAIFG